MFFWFLVFGFWILDFGFLVFGFPLVVRVSLPLPTRDCIRRGALGTGRVHCEHDMASIVPANFATVVAITTVNAAASAALDRLCSVLAIF
jgi:hypothetical protein